MHYWLIGCHTSWQLFGTSTVCSRIMQNGSVTFFSKEHMFWNFQNRNSIFRLWSCLWTWSVTNWTDTIQASRGEKKELKFSLIIVHCIKIYIRRINVVFCHRSVEQREQALNKFSILQGTLCDVISTPCTFYVNTNTIDSKFKCTCDSSESFENSVLWRFNHTCFGIEKWEIEHSFNDFIIALIEVLYILKGRRKNGHTV